MEALRNKLRTKTGASLPRPSGRIAEFVRDPERGSSPIQGSVYAAAFISL